MRVRTGVDGFDPIVGGGLPEGASVILQGPPGTEKDLFGQQFLAEGLRSGGAVVVVISSQSPEQYVESLAQLGVNVKEAIAGNRIKIVDWHSYQERNIAGIEEREHVIRCSVDLTNVGIALSRAIGTLSPGVPRRAVLEVLSPALQAFDVGQVYAFAQSSKAKLSRHAFTTLFLLEKEMHSPATVSGVSQPFDGIIDIDRSREGEAIVRRIGVLSLKDTTPHQRFYELLTLPGRGLIIKPEGPVKTEAMVRVEAPKVPPTLPVPEAPGPSDPPSNRAAMILRIAEERIQVDPKDADALFTKASALAALGDLRGAIGALDVLVDVSDTYPGLWILRAKLFARRGDREGAWESRRKAEEIALREEEKAHTRDTVPCPVCEGAVPLDAQECPNCGARFIEEVGLAEELDSLGKAAIQDKVGEDLHVEPGTGKPADRKPSRPVHRVVESRGPASSEPAVKRGMTNGLAPGSLRGGMGRTNGVTNGLKGRTNGLTNGLKGRTNGLTNGLRGQTNGVGRTNKITNGLQAGGRTNGLTNGLAALRRGMTNGLTNGNGFTNGLGSARFHREAAMTRWKLYSIPLLSFALLLLPLLGPANPAGPTYPITIDGSDTDWQPTAIAGQSPGTGLNPNVDILRFGVADNLDYLAFFAETNGTALRGGDSPPTMDTFRFFLDTDRDASTGYRAGELGADRLVEVSGWQGGVNVSNVYEWDTNRNPSDWRGWIKASSVSAATSGGRLEAQVDWLTLVSPKAPVFVALYSQGFDGSTDVADYSLNSAGASLAISETPVVALTITGANIQLLRLDLTAFGGGVGLSSLTVTLTGSAPFSATNNLRLVDGNGSVLDQRVPLARRVTFQFSLRTVSPGAPLRLFVIADTTSANGDTLGALLAAASDVAAPGAAVTIRRVPSARDVGYMGSTPSGLRIDGGFSEWTASKSDPVGDVAGPRDPNVDLVGFDARGVGNGSFFFTRVTGRMMAGTWVPKANDIAPVTSRSPPDQDRDGVPDSIDPLPYDFNNDGTPDSQSGGDYDGDGILDYGQFGGTDDWLNTTIPASFPVPYANRSVSVYIGPTQEPYRSLDDLVRIFIDIDNNTLTGYGIGGVGADRLVEVTGNGGLVRTSSVSRFTGGSPGAWSWATTSNVSFALGFDRLELGAPGNLTPTGSRMYVEVGGPLGSWDSLAQATRGTRGSPSGLPFGEESTHSSLDVAPDPFPATMPWDRRETGTRASTLLDSGSNAISTQYNHQRKVVRAGDVPSQSACDPTNSDGCWYATFADQAVEQSSYAPQSPKVQNGQSTLAAGTSTLNVTITSIVTTKAFVTFSASFNDANPDFSQVSGQVIDATTIRFQRAKSVAAPAITIEWYVAEFNRGVTVQRNSTTMTANTVNVPISSVALAKSFPIATYRKSGTGYGSDDFLKAKITTSTNLQLSLFNITVFDGVAEWQVIEYTDASVQTGDVTFSPGNPSDSSKTVTIPTVDETKAWLLFTYTADNGTTFNIGQKMVRGLIMTPTTLVFDRNLTFVTLILTWYLVVFTDTTSVQSWRVSFATGQTQRDISIECIDPTKTIVTAGGMYYRGGRTWYGSDDNPGVATVTLDLTTSTNLRLVRGASPEGADIGWYVVEFGTGCPVTGTFPADVQAADGTFIQYREANIGQTAAVNNPTGVGTSPACTFSSCSNGETSDDTYAVSPSDGDIASYKTFGFNIPAGSTITRVRFGVEVFQTGDFNEHLEEMSLSWNAGSNYCGNTFIMIPVGPPDPNAYTFMDQTTCTGHTWSASDFTGDLIAWKGVHIKTGGANPIDLDAVIVEVAYTPPSYKLAVQYDWSGVAVGADLYTVKVKGYRQDENMNVQVLTPPSTWNTRITISNTSNTLYSYDLTASEFNSGAPSIRFVDAAGGDGTASDLWVDYAALVSTTYWDRVILMRSTNASGSTWGTQITLASGRSADSPVLLARDSTEPSIAIDSAGFLHVAWAAASGAGNQQTMNLIRYSKTTVPWPNQVQLGSSSNWEAVTSVDDSAAGFMPTVSTDKGNYPHIAWSGSRTSGSVYYKNQANGTWRATVSWGAAYTGHSVDVSPQNNYTSLVRYYESGTNQIQYTVCRNLASSFCDAASEFTTWDGNPGVDTVASTVLSAGYPTLVTTWDANADLWVGYTTSAGAAKARFLDYPTGGWQPAETIDSLGGTTFARLSLGADRTGNLLAMYVNIATPQLYYKLRTSGVWDASRTAIDTSSEWPVVVVRAPNDALYGSLLGGVYWKSSSSETYFFQIPEFGTLLTPALLVLILFTGRRRLRGRSERRRGQPATAGSQGAAVTSDAQGV